MKKFFGFLTILLLTLAFSLGTAPGRAQAAFPERPVGFVVIDHDGGVSGSVYNSWRQVVKWAYHFPYYKITDDGKAQEICSQALRGDTKVDARTLAVLAEECGCDVLVIARIYAMDDTIVSGFAWHHDDTYVRVLACADLYVYKKDGDKFKKKILRERELREMGNYEKPQETIKWELSKLVNQMENRPIIGS